MKQAIRQETPAFSVSHVANRPLVMELPGIASFIGSGFPEPQESAARWCLLSWAHPPARSSAFRLKEPRSDPSDPSVAQVGVGVEQQAKAERRRRREEFTPMSECSQNNGAEPSSCYLRDKD